VTFNAKQQKGIKRWIGRAAPLKGLFFRSVEYRYMDPMDVLSGAGARAHGGRFAPVDMRTYCAARRGRGVFETAAGVFSICLPPALTKSKIHHEASIASLEPVHKLQIESSRLYARVRVGFTFGSCIRAI